MNEADFLAKFTHFQSHEAIKPLKPDENKAHFGILEHFMGCWSF
jgi:hypothetical protein